MLDLDIKIVDNWPIGEIVNLYKAGGWWRDHFDKNEIPRLIKGSFVFAVVVDEKINKAIGMGRVLSDGISDAYIQDLIILPKYRGRGIGNQLVKKLVNYCKSKNINWIGLIAEPDQDGFYLKLGFTEMVNYIPFKYEE